MPPQSVPEAATRPESQAGSSRPHSRAEERWQTGLSWCQILPAMKQPGLGQSEEREPRPCPGSLGSL